ncbi:RINT1-like protein, partial [Drosera capensis]
MDDILQPLLGKANLASYSAKEALVSAMALLASFWGKMELNDAWKKLKVELEVESFWVTNMKHKADSTTEILSASREDHKAPLIAESVLKFSWKMMQHCKTLRSSCRIQFIRSTSSKLWKFLNVLLLRHDGIWSASNDSVEAIVEICALINAMKFCKFKLQEWSEEVDLLELSVAENGQKLDIRGNTLANACFFDEEIRSMTEMQTSWLVEIAAHVLCQFEAFSFNYFLDMSQFEVVLTDIVHAPIMESTTSHDVAEALDNLRTLLSISVQKAFFPYISDLLKLLKLDREQVADLILSLLDNNKGAKCVGAHGAPHISTDDGRRRLMKSGAVSQEQWTIVWITTFGPTCSRTSQDHSRSEGRLVGNAELISSIFKMCGGPDESNRPDGVRRWFWHALDEATHKSPLGHVVFVPEGALGRQDTDVQLLTQIRARLFRDSIILEHLAGYVVVLSKLQWGCWVN